MLLSDPLLAAETLPTSLLWSLPPFRKPILESKALRRGPCLTPGPLVALGGMLLGGRSTRCRPFPWPSTASERQKASRVGLGGKKRWPWMTSRPGRMAPVGWTTGRCSGRPQQGCESCHGADCLWSAGSIMLGETGSQCPSESAMTSAKADILRNPAPHMTLGLPFMNMSAFVWGQNGLVVYSVISILLQDRIINLVIGGLTSLLVIVSKLLLPGMN